MEPSKTKTPIWDKTNSWYEELESLKTIIQKTELIETTKWGGCVYVWNGKNILGIAGFKKYFTVWFFNGIFLKDQQQLLVNAQEGVTKAMRQWRFTSKDEINEKLILQYIQEAIENEKHGKNHKPETRKSIVSDFFQKELEANKILAEAFSKFSPYKQKEFLEYIETAKREETKRVRMEKIKPMILQNTGLNDKYR